MTIDARFCLQNTTRRCGDFDAKQSLDLASDKAEPIPLHHNFINPEVLRQKYYIVSLILRYYCFVA